MYMHKLQNVRYSGKYFHLKYPTPFHWTGSGVNGNILNSWTVCVGTNIMMDYLKSDWSTQNNRALSHAHRDGSRCGLIRGIILLWVSLLEGMMQSTWNINHKTQTPFCTHWPCGTTVFMNRVKSPLITALVWHSSETILNYFLILV